MAAKSGRIALGASAGSGLDGLGTLGQEPDSLGGLNKGLKRTEVAEPAPTCPWHPRGFQVEQAEDTVEGGAWCSCLLS